MSHIHCVFTLPAVSCGPSPSPTLRFEVLADCTIQSVPPPGRNFLLQVIPEEGSIARRQISQSGFLDSTGVIQAQCQEGSIFRLVSGSLFSGSGQISVSRNVSSARFGTTSLVKAIHTTIAVAVDESFFWNNDAFDGGTARFGADFSMLYAVFSGPLPDHYAPVSLKALDSKHFVTHSAYLRY